MTARYHIVAHHGAELAANSIDAAKLGVDLIEVKHCKPCGRDLPRAAFSPKRGHVQSRCRECHAAQMRERRAAGKDRRRPSRLARLAVGKAGRKRSEQPAIWPLTLVTEGGVSLRRELPTWVEARPVALRAKPYKKARPREATWWFMTRGEVVERLCLLRWGTWPHGAAEAVS